MAPHRAGRKLGPARPEGAPSLFDMTGMVLKDAVKSGKSGLTAQEEMFVDRDRQAVLAGREGAANSTSNLLV